LSDLFIKYQNSPQFYCGQISYNRGVEFSEQKDYGAHDLFLMCENFAKANDIMSIRYVVCAHWDVIFYKPERILELLNGLGEMDVALYFRSINLQNHEALCPHGILFMKKELLIQYSLWSTLPLYSFPGWGVERALRFWFMKHYNSQEIFLLHPKILTLGVVPYESKEVLYAHFHDKSRMIEAIHNE